MRFVETLIVKAIGKEKYFVLDHLAFSGLSMIFLIASFYILDVGAYAALAVAVSFVFLFQLACNNTTLEPMQVYFKRFETRLIVRAMCVTIGIAYALTLALVGLFLLFAQYDAVIAQATLAVSVLSILQLFVFSCRRLILAMQDVGASIRMNLVQGVSLPIALGAAWFLSNAGFMQIAAIVSYMLLYMFPFFYALYQMFNVAKEGASAQINEEDHSVLLVIKEFFLYSKKTFFTVPVVWMFGNFIFVYGGKFFDVQQIALYRMVINFINPLLQYYSAVGIQILSHFSSGISRDDQHLKIKRMIFRNMLAAVGYGILSGAIFLLISKGSFSVWPIFILHLVYVYFESINYLMGSMLRSRRDFGSIFLATALPSVFLFCLVVGLYLLVPTAVQTLPVIQGSVIMALVLSLMIIGRRIFGRRYATAVA